MLTDVKLGIGMILNLKQDNKKNFNPTKIKIGFELNDGRVIYAKAEATSKEMEVISIDTVESDDNSIDITIDLVDVECDESSDAIDLLENIKNIEKVSYIQMNDSLNEDCTIRSFTIYTVPFRNRLTATMESRAMTEYDAHNFVTLKVSPQKKGDRMSEVHTAKPEFLESISTLINKSWKCRTEAFEEMKKEDLTDESLKRYRKRWEQENKMKKSRITKSRRFRFK